jgi:hypothetical protein
MPTTDKDFRVVRSLAILPRGKLDAQGVPAEEFRISLAEFNGNPFLAFRIFYKGPDGEFYPAPGKGCSVRLSEVEEVKDAIMEGLRIANSRREGEPPITQKRPARRPFERPVPPPPAERKTQPPHEIQANALDEFAEYRK